MPKPSFIQKTGQVWKLNGGFVALVLGFGVMVYCIRTSTENIVYAMAGMLLGLLALASMCATIRCPACGFRFFWASVSRQDHDKWLLGLRTQTSCPRCKYQGGTSLRQTLS